MALCSMAAFKQHATFGFWKGALIVVPKTRKPDEAMGDLGRLTAVAMPVPANLKAALARNKNAAATFEALAPSQRHEYVVWVTEAKREETRAAPLKQAIEWLAEGKPRHWKYRAK